MLETPRILGYDTETFKYLTPYRDNPSGAANQQERRMRKTSGLIEVKCGACGIAMIRKPSAIRSAISYCSHKCRASIQFANRDNQRIVSQRSRKNREFLVCEQCGNGFSARPAAKRKFCSQACNQAHRLNEHERSADCVQCRQEFKAQSYLMRRNRKFCSHSCWATWRMTGERNRNWKGGISSDRDRIKATDEYKQWRLAVYRRDHFTCVVCLAQPIKGNTIEAHHLKKFSDYPKLVTELENGCTLCSRCHKQTYGCESLVESFLRSRILRDFTSDTRIPADLVKIKSGLHGDMQRSAEMTDPVCLLASA